MNNEKMYSGLLSDDGPGEQTAQQTIDAACALAVAIADDPSHGYSQANRWGTPDYDCSSMIISVWDAVGVPVKDAGATYTGNMKAAFLSCGFADVSAFVNLVTGSGCEAGDILLNESNHVAMSLGNGRMVWASTSGGHPEPGDQTGKEIRTGAFYSYPWDCCLRFTGEEAPAEPERELFAVVVQLPELRRGDAGYYVQEMQSQLVLHKCSPENTIRRNGTCDGEFGDGTEAALRRFQAMHKLPVTGICNGQCWAALINKSEV